MLERDLQAHLHPQSNAAEGFRTLRAAIALAPKADKYRVLAITSTIPEACTGGFRWRCSVADGPATFGPRRLPGAGPLPAYAVRRSG